MAFSEGGGHKQDSTCKSDVPERQLMMFSVQSSFFVMRDVSKGVCGSIRESIIMDPFNNSFLEQMIRHDFCSSSSHVHVAGVHVPNSLRQVLWVKSRWKASHCASCWPPPLQLHHRLMLMLLGLLSL